MKKEVHIHGYEETEGWALGPRPHRNTRSGERSAESLMASLHYTEAEHISPSGQGRTEKSFQVGVGESWAKGP